MAERRKVIIDTDCGVDDAVALMMALTSDRCEVVAITCVAGNTSLSNVIRNVAKVLEVTGRTDVPFYVGAAKPLLGPHKDPDWPGHGTDGLGDISKSSDYVAPSLQPQSESAVNAIIRIVNENPGQIHILTLGPMTNLALAVSLDPTLASKTASLTSMAGSHTGQGNCNTIAEFNVLTDPEAAQIVFEAGFRHFTIITWCLTLKTAFPWSWYLQHVKPSQSKFGKFIQQITVPISKLRPSEDAPHVGVDALFNLCDTLAVIAFLYPEGIIAQKHVWGVVELAGTHSRGGTFFDFGCTCLVDSPFSNSLLTPAAGAQSVYPIIAQMYTL